MVANLFILNDKTVIRQLYKLKKLNALTEKTSIPWKTIGNEGMPLLQTDFITIVDGTNVYFHPDKVRKNALLIWLLSTLLGSIMIIIISIARYNQPERYDPATSWIWYSFSFGICLLLPYFLIYFPYQRLLRGISRNDAGEWQYINSNPKELK